MRIGILGGTFDPIHNCHIYLARETLKILQLDKVYFIPSGLPPHKSAENITQSEKRLKLVKLALEPYSEFEALDVETLSCETVYSVDTVEKLVASSSDEWFFIMGIDSFLELKTWKAPERLLRLCHFAILPRKDYSFDDIKDVSLFEKLISSDMTISAECEYSRLEIEGGKSLYLINCKQCNVSSTAIRKSLKSGRCLENSLPLTVESYIIKTKIYGWDSEN